MGTNTRIEWAHHSFNPWIGCQRVSPGCQHCYAEAHDARFHAGEHWGPGGTRQVTSAANWRKPVAWNRAAAAAGERHRVFCASLADVFEDLPGLVGLRALLCELIEETPHLDWLLLTKRPEQMLRLQPVGWRHGWPHNVWAGTSVEDQQRADERIPHLLAVPAAVRFLSAEPLLGPVDLQAAFATGYGDCSGCTYDRREQTHQGQTEQHPGPGIDWVICGGESGLDARPMHPDWARSLRDQCLVAAVPFFFKQWGAWGDGDSIEATGVARNGWWENYPSDGGFELVANPPTVYRVGKKAAGRLLDGREWNELPALGRGLAGEPVA